MKRPSVQAVAAAVLVTSIAAAAAGTANAAGSSLDPGFGVGGSLTVPTAQTANVNDLVVRPDGSTIGVGKISDPLTNYYDALVFRIRSDGRYDTSFGIRRLDLGGNESAESVALQPDGKIVVAGSTSTGSDAFVWRLNADGSRDYGFGDDSVRTRGSGGQDRGNDVVVTTGGRIVVVGDTSVNEGQMVAYAFTPGGDPDPTFDQDGAIGFGGKGSTAWAALAQADGRIVVTGYDPSGQTASLYRLTTGGVPDTTFGIQGRASLPATYSSAWDLTRAPGGTMYVLSATSSVSDDDDPVIYRLTTNGEVDVSFGGPRGARFDLGADEYLSRIATLPNGGVVGAGDTSLGDDLLLAQFTAAGRPDRTFSATGFLTRGGAPNYANALAVQRDGKALIGADDDRTLWRPVVLRFLGTSKPPLTCNGRRATIVGTARADRINGTARADVIVALGGNDVVHGRGGNDVICGGAGQDVLYGEAGADALFGGAGTDRLYGGAGRDRTVQ